MGEKRPRRAIAFAHGLTTTLFANAEAIVCPGIQPVDRLMLDEADIAHSFVELLVCFKARQSLEDYSCAEEHQEPLPIQMGEDGHRRRAPIGHGQTIAHRH